jgi:Ca2+:H+ antiporter
MHYWPRIMPPVAIAVLAAAAMLPIGTMLLVASILAVIGSVLAAVHHAEVVAHRVGEPFGTLVLALAITAIEVALIVSLMLAGGVEQAALARDTVYATVMIIVSGVVGICVFLGGLRHPEQSFRIEGAGPAFAGLVTLATLVLIMPVFTSSAPGSGYSPSQLLFVACSSLVLWVVFIFFQTVRHRDYFLPVSGRTDEHVHAPPPSLPQAALSLGLLLVSLVAVVGLAKVLSPDLERALVTVGAPRAVVGIIIALVVLMPETVSAVRAALANRLQTSMNLALGSALASIGLTVPVIVVAAIVLEIPLVLSLAPKDMVLLALSFLVGAISLANGRPNMMQGTVQLVIFAAFLFLAFVP